MTTGWSNEQLVADHKDIQATSMAIDASGRLAALGGRRCVALIDLDSSSVLKKVNRASKWDVSASEWNPIEKHLYALGSNQATEIYDWREWTAPSSSSLSLTSPSLFNTSAGFSGTPTLGINWNHGHQPLITLKGHTRAISDLNWSPFNGRLIATSSIDTFIFIWDTRDYKRPSVTLSSVASASQVKWSKSDENLLATSHEVDVRIWDKRKGNTPIHYIAAHLSKINGLDWNPNVGTQLATCSLDCTVKFWDLLVLRNKAEMILPTTYPSWRAKYTPFGSGIITVVVPPQVRPRGDHSSLYLWHVNALEQPVYQFVSHSDVVIEFGWRRNVKDNLELVTWSKDSSLRIWNIDQQVMNLVSNDQSPASTLLGEDLLGKVEEGNEATPEVMEEVMKQSVREQLATKSPKGKNVARLRNLSGSQATRSLYDDTNTKLKLPKTPTTPTVAGIPKMSDVSISISMSPSASQSLAKCASNSLPLLSPPASSHTPSSSLPADLQQEFALININIPNLKFEEISSRERFCLIAAMSADKVFACRLKITFPVAYPNNVIPIFALIVDEERKRPMIEIKSQLLRTLQTVAHTQVKRNRPCLEPCLRQFMAKLEKLCSNKPPAYLPLAQVMADYNNLYSSFQDSTVPFPRTSGGRFCGADILVCFGRPPHLQQMNAEFTPKSLSALSAYLSTNYRVVSVTTPTSSTSASSGPGNLKNNTKGAKLGLAFDGDSLQSAQVPVPVSNFYYTNKRRVKKPVKGHKRTLFESGSNHSNLTTKCGNIFVYDIGGLLPFSRKLGQTYVFNDNITRMCRENANAAAVVGRKDLIQTWSLAKLAAASNLNPSNDVNLMDSPWPVHPFGRKMIQSLIDHYLNTCGDVQTAAMLACTFTGKSDTYTKMSTGLRPNTKSSSNLSGSSPGNSPYHTVGHGAVGSAYVSAVQETNLDEWNLVTAVDSLKNRYRSNSWSDSAENDLLHNLTAQPSSAWTSATAAYRYHCNEMILLRDQREAERHEINLKMVDPKASLQLDYVKQIYADLLLRWGLHDKRAQVLKYVNSNNNYQSIVHRGVDFVSSCLECGNDYRGPHCVQCKRYTTHCVVCNLSVKGATNFCMSCGHGGHTNHMSEWFSLYEECPSGCGCHCLVNSFINCF